MMSLQSVFQKRVRNPILMAFIIIGAMRLYYVREMMAALIISSALFALAAGVGLILFLLDRAGPRTLAWTEVRTKSFARTASIYAHSSGDYSHSSDGTSSQIGASRELMKRWLDHSA